MAELAADLARLAAGMPVRAVALPPVVAQEEVVSVPEVAAPSAPAPTPAPVLPPPSTGGQGVPWPLVLLLLVLVAGGAYWFSRDRKPSALAGATQAEPRPLPPPLVSAAEADDGAPEHEVALVLFPLDARVMLGDKDLGQMPVSVKVKDGHPIKVRIVRDGYWTRKLSLDGTKKRVVIGLVKRDDSRANPNGEDDDPPGALPRSVPAK
jgi:LPXTG-motif cell wall-anchored protein